MTMQSLFLTSTLLLTTTSALAAFKPGADAAPPLDYPSTDLRHYMSPKDANFVRPGLVLVSDADSVDIAADGTVSIVFSIADDRGLPLDLDGVTTPGPVAVRFVLGYTPEDAGKYVSYTLRTQTSPITGDSAIQPTSDSGGSFEQVAEGSYRYTFGTQLPADFDGARTHTVGIYAERDLTEFEMGEHVANELIHFVPNGGTPVVREITTTETCNNCHDPLGIHGGVRREVGLCIMCHTDGVLDPDTGVEVDMGEMIHSIHMGEDLPSVQAGTPYAIIGFRQSVHDYSTVIFPQDIRNCESCHTPQADQSDAWFSRPTRENCGACHNDVDFATGENHVGGPAVSDMFCANCHFPEGELEFDASVIGAHTIPNKSRQLAGVNITLLDVIDTLPGMNPTVRFSLSNDEGEPIDFEDMGRLVMLMSGPNVDYSFLARETVGAATSTGIAGEYTYTFETPLPEMSSGSYTIGVEGRQDAVLNAGLTNEMSVRDTAENPTLAFAVTDMEPASRRRVVDDAKCEACHENLSLHGDNRHNATHYCQMCHQPGADDSAVRPPEAAPPRTIDFKFLIHRIHTGEELDRDYTVYGFRGSVHNYNHVLYPGDLRNCEACHVNDSQQVPSGASLWTQATENEFYAPMPPNSTACLGCHDGLDAAAHTAVNTAPFGESCGACHGEGKEFSVDRVHARIE